MQFQGHLEPTRIYDYSIVSGGAARMMIGVSISDRAPVAVDFQIDTGADVTVISPNDAIVILGSSYLTLNFSRDARLVSAIGVGGTARRVVRDATLHLESTEGNPWRIVLPILIAEPVPRAPSRSGNWQLPSLLGRDFLRHFRLELSYGDAPQVLLEPL